MSKRATSRKTALPKEKAKRGNGEMGFPTKDSIFEAAAADGRNALSATRRLRYTIRNVANWIDGHSPGPRLRAPATSIEEG